MTLKILSPYLQCQCFWKMNTKTNNLIAIAATSLLYVAAVPVVLCFSGYVVSDGKTNYVHHKYWRSMSRNQVEVCDGASSRHFSVQLQMSDERNDDTIADSDLHDEVRVSKRKRIVSSLRRLFTFGKRQSLDIEQNDELLEEEETIIPFIEGVSDEVVDEKEVKSLEKITSALEDEESEENELMDENENDAAPGNTTTPSPISSRQATASPSTDLSGTWAPIVTPSFKLQYDDYLKNCSQSFVFRKVIVNGIEFQKETIRQLDNGRNLEINAKNPAGNWNRTLVASDVDNPLYTEMIDPDKDSVNVECWWEDNGTKHKSVLRGKPRINGGVFETVRYLDEEDGDVLICESSFLPSELEGSSSRFKFGHVCWRFQRV